MKISLNVTASDLSFVMEVDLQISNSGYEKKKIILNKLIEENIVGILTDKSDKYKNYIRDKVKELYASEVRVEKLKKIHKYQKTK
jgi:hypothetical protein